jgi:hypothetical protein
VLDSQLLFSRYGAIEIGLCFLSHKESYRAVESYISPYRKEGSAKATGIANCIERLMEFR